LSSTTGSGGATATQGDFAHVLSGKLPLFIGVVVLLSFLLLALVLGARLAYFVTASVTLAIGTNPGSGTLSGTTTVSASWRPPAFVDTWWLGDQAAFGSSCL